MKRGNGANSVCLGCKHFSYNVAVSAMRNSRGGDLGRAWTYHLGSSKTIDGEERGLQCKRM